MDGHFLKFIDFQLRRNMNAPDALMSGAFAFRVLHLDFFYFQQELKTLTTFMIQGLITLRLT